MLSEQRLKAIPKVLADGVLHNKARDETRRIHNAFALTLGGFRQRFATYFSVLLFDIGNRLLKNMAEDRDRSLTFKVVSRDVPELIRDVVWNG